MTKAELEKQNVSLESRIEKLEVENEELRRRTATREPAADEIRNLYAVYLNRCAKVNNLRCLNDLEEAAVHAKIRDEEYERYKGAQTLYCVLFEQREPCQSRFGDRRWTPWINYEIISREEMARRPEWQEAMERYTQSLMELSKERRRQNGVEN